MKIFNKGLMLISLIITLFSGCDWDENNTLLQADIKGQLVDSHISGVSYTTSSGKTGVTDHDGYFIYSLEDTTITFNIGNLKVADFNLSAINTDHKILPADLVGVDRNNSTDVNVLKLIRLFQSLDDDNNPYNGINITDSIKNGIVIENNVSDINITTLNSIVDTTGKSFKSELNSKAHYEEILRDVFLLSYVDTIAPVIPTLSIDINSTAQSSTIVEVNGEVGSTIYINGIDTNQTIDSTGRTNILLDTNATIGNINDFRITIRDRNNNISNILEFSVTKLRPLYIKSAIYDNNQTQTVNDDKLSLYINAQIDINSINVDMSTNYNINGIGAVGSASTSEYNDTIFHRHNIFLNSNGTASTEFSTNGDTNISFTKNTITYIDDTYRTIFDEVVVEKFDILARLNTGQTTSYVEDGDGNTTEGLSRSYTNNGDTVSDNTTGLNWQKEDDDITKNWADAITYCGDITLDGNSDFRLPTIEELTSITDKELIDPSINAMFINTNNSKYWSSTSDSENDANAWTINFDHATDLEAIKTSVYYVRCVQ